MTALNDNKSIERIKLLTLTLNKTSYLMNKLKNKATPDICYTIIDNLNIIILNIDNNNFTFNSKTIKNDTIVLRDFFITFIYALNTKNNYLVKKYKDLIYDNYSNLCNNVNAELLFLLNKSQL